jgi:RecB family exonuclease
MDGQLRIIDYKTGKFEASEMKLTSAEELLMPKKLKAFQLLAYTWLYRAQEAPSELPSVGILSFRIMREGPKMLEIQGSQMDEALNWFEQALQQIVEDLINPELPISQTTDHDLCKHCDFKGICNR